MSENHMTKIEFDVEHIKRDISELKADIRCLRKSILDSNIDITLLHQMIEDIKRGLADMNR